MSELISAEGIVRNNKPTFRLAHFEESERPLGIQLFGANAKTMGEAANKIAELRPDFIDLNFGCPANKVVTKNGGSFLLKDLDLMALIIKSVVDAVSVPVTIKIRSGWDDSSLVFLEAGRMAEALGVSAITIHPRTRVAGFSGEAEWDHIRLLKESVSIPVIGNGDIKSPMAAKEMISRTKCDGIMIGRAALGNPWLINRIKKYINDEIIIPEPTVAEKLDVALRHFDYMSSYYGNQAAIYKMRSHFCWYLKNLPNSARIKAQIVRAQSIEDIKRIFSIYINIIETGQIEVAAE